MLFNQACIFGRLGDVNQRLPTKFVKHGVSLEKREAGGEWAYGNIGPNCCVRAGVVDVLGGEGGVWVEGEVERACAGVLRG